MSWRLGAGGYVMMINHSYILYVRVSQKVVFSLGTLFRRSWEYMRSFLSVTLIHLVINMNALDGC